MTTCDVQQFVVKPCLACLEVILEEHITDTQAQCRQKTSDVVGICEMCEQLSDEFCAIFYRATATGPAVGRAAR